MQKSKYNLRKKQEFDSKTFLKAQEILKKSLIKISTKKDGQKKIIDQSKFMETSRKVILLKKIGSGYIRKISKGFLKFNSQRIFDQFISNFYRGYKFYIYSYCIQMTLALEKKLKSLKNIAEKENRIYKFYFKKIYPKILIFHFHLSTFNKYLKKLKPNFKIFRYLLKDTLQKQYKIFEFGKFNSLILLNLIFKFERLLENQLGKPLNNLLNELKDSLNGFIKKQKLSFFIDSFNKSILKINTYLDKFKKSILSLLFLEKSQVINYLKRLRLVIGIYFIPFIFLASQALVPVIDDYEYLVVNPISGRIFAKIPFLLHIIKCVQPLITSESSIPVWMVILYFLTFSLHYRELNLSYNVAYNGTLAYVFLMINYTRSLGQVILNLILDSIKMIRDIVFVSYLIEHLDENKNKGRQEALRIFSSLVQKYDLAIKKKYYQSSLSINQLIFSHLAFISLGALLYNCIYYVAYNKNPQIPLITKMATATIKNPKEEN